MLEFTKRMPRYERITFQEVSMQKIEELATQSLHDDDDDDDDEDSNYDADDYDDDNDYYDDDYQYDDDDDAMGGISLRRVKMLIGDISDHFESMSKKGEITADRCREAKELEKLLKTSNDYNALFACLSTKAGQDIFSKLANKLKELNPSFCKDILNHLTEAYTNIFFDTAFLILAQECKAQDISADIIATLKTNKIRNPLDFASLLMTLGQTRNRENLPLLYGFYEFFVDNFPDENHMLGPLLAIQDIVNQSEV